MSTPRFRPVRRAALSAALLALSLSPLAAMAAGEPLGRTGVSVRDGVVLDTALAVAYVGHPQGGVAAIDLRTGGTLWRSAAAERPLAVEGDLLVAQARPGARGELRVVALDRSHGGARRAEADLPMPEGIRAEASETVDHFFRLSATPSPQGLVLNWDSENRPGLPREGRPASGTDPAAAALGAKRTAWGSLQGFALFDPHAGRLLPVESGQAVQLAGSRKALAASLASSDPSERRFTSLDGRYVLASRKVGELKAVGNPYRWTISEAASGRVLGTIESRVSMAPFLVVENRVVHIAQPRTERDGTELRDLPLRLRAVDLASGRESWTAAVRDTAFQGPTPH